MPEPVIISQLNFGELVYSAPTTYRSVSWRLFANIIFVDPHTWTWPGTMHIPTPTSIFSFTLTSWATDFLLLHLWAGSSSGRSWGWLIRVRTVFKYITLTEHESLPRNPNKEVMVLGVNANGNKIEPVRKLFVWLKRLGCSVKKLKMPRVHVQSLHISLSTSDRSLITSLVKWGKYRL